MTPKPTIILLHGVWHSPVTYTKLTNALQGEGYDVYTPFFQSCVGACPPTASLPEDTQLARRLVEMLADLGKTVVVVMHSYGGVVGCNAIQDLDIESRKLAGKPGGVAHLVGLAAHIHPRGFSVLDIVREMGHEELIPMAFDIAEDGTCFSGAPRLLFSGVPDEEADTLVKTLSRASWKSLDDKVQFDGWRHVPLTYVHTTQDSVLPLEYQRRILEKLEKAGYKADVVEMATSHAPFVTMTDEVIKVINNVASKVA